VSNLNKKTYAKIEAWQNRRIEGEHPYLYLDGIVIVQIQVPMLPLALNRSTNALSVGLPGRLNSVKFDFVIG
jgi:hypothetical protein